ncbi:MAG TPA: homocysteine S-methyltransferase family protein [Anaerolineales bacterium]|nr:homocysteine S-methyltransferase family protein [Anaerolineales bacterium]
MNPFLERLANGATLVADGATGTNLQKVGLGAGMHSEDWVLDFPERIIDLEKSFVAAGSDIILTCTFGATRPRMKGARHADRVPEINRRAVELAREAARGRDGVLVAGSIGPLGQILKPYGPMAPDDARAAFLEQAEALAEGGVDLLLIETHFSCEEATAAFEAARSVTDLPIVVSFSYDRGVRTMMGVRPTEMITRYQQCGATMVGANCGTSLENMQSIIGEYAASAAGLPLWAKPNAGMPRLENGETHYDVMPEEMASFAQKYVELGARVVGGCCGSTPQHVAAIAKAVNR